MFVAPKEAGYFLTEEEKDAVSSLSKNRWKKVCVQSGEISSRQYIEEYVYSVSSIVVETETRLLIMLDSNELENGTEIFKLAVVLNEDEISRMLSMMYPPVTELIHYPKDLDIGSFVGADNDVFLLRFHEMLGERENRINVETDSGLLVSNVCGRLLLYPNKDIPLDFCITTNAEKIDAILDKQDIVPCT